MKDYIEKTVRPKIQGDGGEVSFESFKDNVLTLVFEGECSKCLILERCCKWIRDEIKREKGQSVTVNAIRKKPYFWDK